MNHHITAEANNNVKHQQQRVNNKQLTGNVCFLSVNVNVLQFVAQTLGPLSCTHTSLLIHSPFLALVTLRLSLSLKPSPTDCLHWIQMFHSDRERGRKRERDTQWE